MASKSFKVTDNQKHVAELLYNFGNLSEWHTGERVLPSRVTELIKKGIFEKTNGDSPLNYWELRFTVEGQEWADDTFGTPDPTPDSTDTAPSSTPDGASAGERVSQYSDYVRERTWKAAREFHKNSGATMSEFYADCGRNWEDMSDAAIAEWLRYDHEDESRMRKAEDDSHPLAISTPAPDSPSPDDSEYNPIASWDSDYEDTSVLYADFVREQYARADAEDLAEMNSDPVTVAPEDVYFENPEMLDDYSGIDWKPLNPDWKEVSAGVWVYKHEFPVDPQPVTRVQWTHKAVEWCDIVTGHGRPPRRNRRNQPKTAKFSDLRHRKTSGINMELKTQEAQIWRNRRNLANAVAVPIPAITGAELLARGQQLAVVEKPKLTRILETRGRAA